MILFGYKQICTGHCYPSFSKILIIVLSQILLPGIVKKFEGNIFTLRDIIDVILGGIVCYWELLACFFQTFLSIDILVSIK